MSTETPLVRRVLAFGEGRWNAPPPKGLFTYVEFHIDDVAYNEGDLDRAPRSAPPTVPVLTP